MESDRFSSSLQGYWVFFVLEGNGPVSSVYKALQVIDFYLGFILPCHPIFGMDVSIGGGGAKADNLNLVLAVFNQSFLLLYPQSVVLMREVLNTKQHNWIIHGIAGMGVAICVVMVKHGMIPDFQLFIYLLL